MRVLIILISLSLAAILGAAPPHPTRIRVQYEGNFYAPVANMKGDDPIVYVKGKKERIRNKPVYKAIRARKYSSKSLTVLSANLDGNQREFAGVTPSDSTPEPLRSTKNGQGELTVTLKSEHTLKNAYIALIPIEPSRLDFQSIFVHGLPKIPKGRPTQVKFTSNLFSQAKDTPYCIQIFDKGGAEIQTNVHHQGWEFYTKMEQQAHADVVLKYLSQHQGEDYPARPVLFITPILPSGSAIPTTPVIARFWIAPNGHVEKTTLDGNYDPVVEATIKDSLQGWLWIPRIKKGLPVASQIKVPIKF